MTLQLLRFGAFTLAIAAVSCTGDITDPGSDGLAGSGPGPGQQPGGAGASGTGSPGAGTSGSIPNPPGSGGAGSIPNPGGGGASSIPDPTGRLNLNGSPKHYRVVRLTNDQWTNSVQSVLRLSSPPTNAEAFQDAVSGTTDFTNNELVLDIDSRGWSDYQAAAEALAAQVTSDQALLSRLYSGTDAAGFINSVGRRVYRRPLTQAETQAYQGLYDVGTKLSGTKSAFAKGASVVLEAMLQSPFFLYRTELGAASAPLSGFEMAAKLSLWLRDSTPDDSLLEAAAGGSLDTPDGAAAQAQKLLDDPAAKSVMRKFHGEFLHFDRFDLLSKVNVSNYDPAINTELAESSYLFFDKIFSQGLGVKDIFLSTSGFVGPKMAPLYEGGMAAPASGFAERTLGNNRVGYFMQLPFLMLYAHNAQPDPIHRGVSMSLDVLCAPLGPPADEIPPLPSRKPGQTNRQVVDEHTRSCGLACHNLMINPLGFAFENFDGMGQYRETEKYGNEVLPVDASGSFEFVGGIKNYQNAAELMTVVATDPQTHLCYSKKLAGYGLQRDIVNSDLPLLTRLSSTSTASGGSLKQVILDLVKQDAFRTRVGGVQ